MESPNQDAMLNEQGKTFTPNTGGLMQTPDQNTMLNEEYNPSDLPGESTAPAGIAPAGTPERHRPERDQPGDAHTLPTTPTDEEEATTGNDGTGAVSGSPNMEPDTTIDGFGNSDTLGNNDGTEPDPELN